MITKNPKKLNNLISGDYELIFDGIDHNENYVELIQNRLKILLPEYIGMINDNLSEFDTRLISVPILTPNINSKEHHRRNPKFIKLILSKGWFLYNNEYGMYIITDFFTRDTEIRFQISNSKRNICIYSRFDYLDFNTGNASTNLNHVSEIDILLNNSMIWT